MAETILTAKANSGAGTDTLQTFVTAGGAHAGAAVLVDATNAPIGLGNPLPVSGTFFPAIQAVSQSGAWSVATGGLTDAQLRAVAVPVSFTWSGLTDVQLRATAVPVSVSSLPLPAGAATEATVAAISAKTPALGQTVAASSSPVVIASNQTAIPITGGVTGSGTFTTGGVSAHSAAAVGNPVQIGGVVATTVSINEVAGDMCRAAMTTGGAQVVKVFSVPEVDWTFASVAGGIVNTADVVLRAAAGASIRNYLTAISITNASAMIATEVVVKDGAVVIWRGFVGAQTLLNSVVGVTFPTPLRSTANTALNVACVTTGAAVYVNAQGYAAP
jgi:hypothetical protein